MFDHQGHSTASYLTKRLNCKYVNSVYRWVRQHVDSDTGCRSSPKVDMYQKFVHIERLSDWAKKWHLEGCNLIMPNYATVIFFPLWISDFRWEVCWRRNVNLTSSKLPSDNRFFRYSGCNIIVILLTAADNSFLFFEGERSKAQGWKAYLFEMCDCLSKMWLEENVCMSLKTRVC